MPESSRTYRWRYLKKGTVTVRGEAVISYADFEEINRTIGDADAKYKNPRIFSERNLTQ